jgi:hypothetical protein
MAVATADQEMAEPGGRYIDFLVPGLLGMGLMGGGLWGVGFVTVDMRIRKLLKRFLATPMKRSDFLLGLMLSRFVFMVPEILLMLLFAWLAFGEVPGGEWRDRQVWIRTVGYVPFSALEALQLGDTPSYQVELVEGGRVLPGESKVVKVRFHPLRWMTAGAPISIAQFATLPVLSSRTSM